MYVDITNTDTMIKGYINSVLLEEFPDLDISENSVVYDILVKSFVKICGPLIDSVNKQDMKSNFNNAEMFTDEELDEVGSGNYFLTREEGKEATTVLTLYFANLPLDYPGYTLKIPLGTTFATADGLEYQTTQTYMFSSDDLRRNYDIIKSLYEVNIVIEASEVGSKYNVSLGEINVCKTQFSSALVKVTNQSEVTDGEDRESNERFISRIREWYASRYIGTAPGYRNFIMEAYPEVKDVYPVGKDDPYMQRDLVTIINASGQQEQIHIGGKVDIYVKGCIYETMEKEVTVTSNNILLPIKATDLVNQTDLKSNFSVFNLSDQTKQPMIDKLTVLSTEYGGLYTGQILINLNNTNDRSFSSVDLSNMKISYSYIANDTTMTQDFNFQIGADTISLDSPLADSGIVAFVNEDGSLLDNVDYRHILTKSGILGSSDEIATMQLRNCDDLINSSTIVVQYNVNRTLRQVGDTLNDTDFRIITTDTVVFEAQPENIDISLRLKLNNEMRTINEEDMVIKTMVSLNKFFDSLPLGANVESSDIVSWLYQDATLKDYINYIAMPFDVFKKSSESSGEADGVITIDNIKYAALNMNNINISIIE